MITERARLGGWAWVLAIQFFLVQAVVQSAWDTPFSLRTNFISDLGNTACAAYPPGSDSYVCSPWHALMNVSFLVLGASKVFGSILAWPVFRPSRWAAAGLVLLAVSGVGAIMVGLFPENVNGTLHRTGAGLDLVSGNLAIVVIGMALLPAGRAGDLALYSVVSGLVGLTALGLFVSERYLGLGIGGMERLAAYPISLWMIVAGAALLAGWRLVPAGAKL